MRVKLHYMYDALEVRLTRYFCEWQQWPVDEAKTTVDEFVIEYVPDGHKFIGTQKDSGFLAFVQNVIKFGVASEQQDE